MDGSSSGWSLPWASWQHGMILLLSECGYFVLSELVMAALVDLQLHIQVTSIVEWGSNTWDAGLEVHAN